MCKRLKLIPSYSYEKREIEEHLKEYVDKIECFLRAWKTSMVQMQ